MEETHESQNKKTVLVVDDNAAILKSVSRLVKDRDHFLAVPIAKEALQQSKDFKSEIHPLLSAFLVPEMTAWKWAAEIHRPIIKVLRMSGFRNTCAQRRMGFLGEPLSLSQLRALISGLVSSDKNQIRERLNGMPQLVVDYPWTE